MSNTRSYFLYAQYSSNIADWVQNFKFEKGKTGDYVYGRIVTIINGDKIDLACCTCTLKFKFSDKK